jgi:pimeloyl-ACP methyl ester carboxylesterase
MRIFSHGINSMMSAAKPAFVFVHGAWHNSGSWQFVAPALESHGYCTRTLDLPGAGKCAEPPQSYLRRPLQIEMFTREHSPSANITQQQRTSAVISLIEDVAEQTDQKVILVAHSLGGITASAVAETIPDHLLTVVYLTAFMLPPGMTALEQIRHESMATAGVPPLFLADPEEVQAVRIDPRSSDATYQSKLRQAFFADISDEIYAREIPRLHCDEPLGVFLTPTSTTPARFGRVPRNYIRCLEDQAIPWTGQNFMIQAVDGAMGGATRTHDLASSHSPFYSQPNELAELLLWIAQSSLPIGERSTKRVPGPSRRSGV